MVNAVLIDDDQSNLSALSEKLSRHCPEVTICARCDNALDGKEAIERIQPDLVFLDIEMPVMNGFVMLQQLSYRDFELIFVTAYDHYAINAIRYSALDYLVKPVDVDELRSAITRAVNNRKSSSAHLQLELLLEQINVKQLKRISVPTAEGLQFLNIDEIIYLEASNNYTTIFLASNARHLVARTLKDFEDMLANTIFFRIHHSTLINLNYVEKYIRGEGGQVMMKNGKMLDVSKRKKPEFLLAISK